ncbi:Hypp5462 [Branchiostoma lanceolatum]|uniref:Hypp5462 protein n=1 Tax=Branchiostoma lanceolatum TaxID=7740 RepID=A0A8J9YQ72_BRALA|nr:Hypp5462 [Branchiostoma lanceolatum]
MAAYRYRLMNRVLCKGFYKKKTQKAQLRDDNDVLFGVTTLVWNDKLKPYGFCLHGCINGYSRRCMWLHVGTTNKDAAVVATLYLNTVNQLEGCPQLVRSDPGTENVVRIEAFWSHLRPTVVWWIGVFQEMAAHGDLEVGNFLHKGILRFCFMPIIRQQLLEFMED